jgi:hypothetical protein
MRKLLTVVLVCGCGGSNVNTIEPAPRPSPEQGGFQATQPVVDSWIRLGTPVEVSPIQQNVDVGGRGGAIAQLLIKGVSGEPEIATVQIEYLDKTMKKVDLHRRFVPGDGQVVELKIERPIDKIIVHLDPDSRGTFEIFGG